MFVLSIAPLLTESAEPGNEETDQKRQQPYEQSFSIKLVNSRGLSGIDLLHGSVVRQFCS